MDFTTHIRDAFLSHLPDIIQQYPDEAQAESLSEMEKNVKEMTHQLGNEIMKAWLEVQDEKYPSEQKPCQCGQKANYVRRREGMSIILQGRVYYRRAYYLCEHCGRGYYPLDRQLGIQAGEMSVEVVKLAALLGVQDAFVPSSDILAQTTLLELSSNSIRKATRVVGQAVVASEEAQIERSQDLNAQLEQKRSENKPQRLYGSMDGFFVLLKTGWHEMKSGAWWTVDEKGKAVNIRYYVDSARAGLFSRLVWATGFEQQADQAFELVFVADGAEWIWKIVEQHYPRAVQIIDWYHACEYIAPVAEVAFKEQSQRESWIEQIRTHLWQGELDEVIAACAKHIDPQCPDDPAQKAVTYYTNNRQRMDYPTYRQQGYQIGSGTMESACKQIGLARLKIAGARWSEEGARKVAKARAAYLCLPPLSRPQKCKTKLVFHTMIVL